MSANAGSPPAHPDLAHYQYYLINGAFLSFLTPIPALASLFLAWIARRNRMQTRQDQSQAWAPKSSNPLQRRLMLAAHVILWATFLSFLSSAITVVIQGLHPPSVPTTIPVARLMIGSLICNALATLVFQSTGEGVLVYQFMRMYPDPKPRRRVLPLAAVLILVRFLSQTFNQVLHVALTVFPTSDAVASWLEWQATGAWIYSIALTSLILLLSASFVFKLWSRWREYRASTRHHHHRHDSDQQRSSSHGYYSRLLPSSMYRVQRVLTASWHHTVLSSISVVVMTVSFSYMSTSEAARWINAIFTSIFKLVFSLGIAQSLFHLCFDQSVLFQPLAGHHPGQLLPQHIGGVPAAGDMFGSDATLTDPSFRYNPWDARPAASRGTYGNEGMFESAHDPRAAHGYARRGDGGTRGYPTSTSWPVQSTHIESADLGMLGQSHHYPPRRSSSGRDRGGYSAPLLSQGRRGQSPSGYRL